MSKGWIKIYRKFDDSKISNKPPHYRELWLYLIRNANHKPNDELGIGRGQLFRSYNQIMHDLAWYEGYRKCTYKKHHMVRAMAYLTENAMVETAKSTAGMLITVCKYDTYQDARNDERNDGRNTEETQDKHRSSTINKNEEECNKNDKRMEGYSDPLNFSETLADVQTPKAKAIKIWTEYYSPVIGQDSADYVDMILRMIAAHQKEANKANGTPNAKVTDEQKLLLFEQLCERMPEFYKTKASPKLVYSNFDSIFAEIVNQSQKDKPTDWSKYIK